MEGDPARGEEHGVRHRLVVDVAGRGRPGHGDRAVLQHRHVRRGAARRGGASAAVTTGQQLGTSLLNTVFASAVASYLTAHAASEGLA